jgi:dihydroorotase
VSTKESVELVRRAKAEGLRVSCETAPHYLVLCDEDLREDGRFKMNPPLRSREDRAALIEGIKDGTIDVIATDHAPHSVEEKSKGLEKSAFGIVGLETAFPLLYTNLVLKNVISLERLVELMSCGPRRIFGIEGGLREGMPADMAVFDLEEEFTINPEEFASKGRNTPFGGWKVKGKTVLTMVDGKIVYKDPEVIIN